MRPNSLAARLTAGATLWTAVALVVAGVILTSLYRQTVERAFDERLAVYLKTLVGTLAQQEPGRLGDPGNLGEQRFELVYSGWYWQVERVGGPVVLASESLFTDTLDMTRAQNIERNEGVVSATLAGPSGQSLRVLERMIIFDAQNRFEVIVAGDAGELAEEIASFRTSVVLTLAAFGAGLILSTAIQVRWGLRPLDRVRRGLADLRSGKEHHIEGPFPAEIEPLAKELNALLDSNREVIERARTHVGNLAHALKTPLSVITNEARATSGPLAQKVAEQAEIMRMQINHHLDRARIAARAQVIGALTEVEPVIARLGRAMNRIYAERGVTVTIEIDKGVKFRGEQQDLEEMAGNLVDNACKWAMTTVSVKAALLGAEGDPERALVLWVDDDGPGLTSEQATEVMRRGKRLDESKPGSGLGLSIVAELAQLYRGGFRLDRAPLGGLRAELKLPAA
ncbi:ATP-binding protein [Prosthecomicrobium pneumaticum]|uniref:histidine kinase n=1 Tax=Prosthecomicrobium pneumaticum TaxID=81895 RepID=A0A7W9FP78_9HYPH|nr:ATP-binding protein [Prosthecomicrobium pneumaticum]MBB5754333.1 signal transduction histidine kinase [Prosthecomicrobium pneumaticum]